MATPDLSKMDDFTLGQLLTEYMRLENDRCQALRVGDEDYAHVQGLEVDAIVAELTRRMTPPPTPHERKTMATDKYDDIVSMVVYRILGAFHVSPRHEPPLLNLHDEIAQGIIRAATPPPGCVRIGDKDVPAWPEAPFVGQTCDCVPVRLGDPVYHPDINHDLAQDHYRASWNETPINKFSGQPAWEKLGSIPRWYSTREAAEAARSGQ